MNRYRQIQELIEYVIWIDCHNEELAATTAEAQEALRSLVADEIRRTDRRWGLGGKPGFVSDALNLDEKSSIEFVNRNC